MRTDRDHRNTSAMPTSKTQRQLIGDAISQAMYDMQISNRALSARLALVDPSINEEKVSNYRRGKVSLPAALAQVVARELGMRDERSSDEIVRYFGYDPMVMVRLYGLAPADEQNEELLRRLESWVGEPPDEALVRRLVLLEGLDTKIEEREQELADLARERGVPALVRSIVDTGDYAAAVWPVLVGPPDLPHVRVHISDRVDIRRLDGSAVSEDAVWSDLGGALSRAKALPSIAVPRWPGTGSQPVESADPQLSMWNVRRLDAPRGPRIQQPHRGFSAVVVSATISNTWVGYLASMVAYALGYGLTSTTDVARRGEAPTCFNPSTESRNFVHDGLLRQPGERRVWFHAAKTDPGNELNPWQPCGATAAECILHVRLVEADELLESTAEDRRRQPGFLDTDPDAVQDWRRSRDAALTSMPQDEWHLALTVPDLAWGSPEKWESTLRLAVKVLERLRDLGLRPPAGFDATLRSAARLDPVCAAPMLRWMASRGTPFLEGFEGGTELME